MKAMRKANKTLREIGAALDMPYTTVARILDREKVPDRFIGGGYVAYLPTNFFEVAEEYDRMAERAEQRQTANEPKK
jgi:hypothetical protein